VINVILSQHGMEDIVETDFFALDFDFVCGLETFPHRIVSQSFQEFWLTKLYLAQFPQCHIVHHIQPETLLNYLELVPVLLGIHGLLEPELGGGKSPLFTLDFIEFILYAVEIFLGEFVVLWINQAEVFLVELYDGSEEFDCFLVRISDQLELSECRVSKALILHELFNIELEFIRL